MSARIHSVLLYCLAYSATFLLSAICMLPSVAIAQSNASNPYESLSREEVAEIVNLKMQAEKGEASAQFRLALKYDLGKGAPQDFKEAVAWYRKAAEQGHAIAQFNLALLYAKGQGVPQDYKEAAIWYRKAAEQGNASAQLNLGNLFSDGRGVSQDYKEGVAWYRKAAEQGNAIAQFNLALQYANGQGIPQDYKEAAAWYRKAAEQGHADALNNLGVHYKKGQGIQRDVVLAYLLYNLAATHGSAKGAQNRTEITGQLTPRQLEEGQALSSKWKIGMPIPTTSKTGAEIVARKETMAEPPAKAPPKLTGNCRPSGPSIRCRSKCTNGDCIVTYENGCEIRVQVQPKFNPFNSQWEYPAPGC